jgi:hypothetical protein
VPEEIVPVISTSAVGPLGIAHLPRLWAKILLHACGRLPEGYRHGVGGFDELVLTRIGVDGDAFVRYVETERPTYLETEAWVKAHATNLTPEAIAEVNANMTSRQMSPEMAAPRRAALGITDESIGNAIVLNNLDDWAAFHRALVGAPSAAAP